MMKFTKHFRNMLEERSIRQEWVDKSVSEPEEVEDQEDSRRHFLPPEIGLLAWVFDVEDHEDGTQHFLRRIEEHENRWLRVVINIHVQPHRAVTAFFDRRLRKNQ